MEKIEDIIEKWESYGLLDDDLVNKKNMALTFNELIANEFIINNVNEDTDSSTFFPILRRLIQDVVDDLDVEVIKKIIEFVIKDFISFLYKPEIYDFANALSYATDNIIPELIHYYHTEKNIYKIIEKLKSK